MFKSLLAMGATYAGKMAVNYIMQNMQSKYAAGAADHQAKVETPSPSPLEEPWTNA